MRRDPLLWCCCTGLGCPVAPGARLFRRSPSTSTCWPSTFLASGSPNRCPRGAGGKRRRPSRRSRHRRAAHRSSCPSCVKSSTMNGFCGSSRTCSKQGTWNNGHTIQHYLAAHKEVVESQKVVPTSFRRSLRKSYPPHFPWTMISFRRTTCS
jgi:hypothetical protein